MNEFDCRGFPIGKCALTDEQIKKIILEAIEDTFSWMDLEEVFLSMGIRSEETE
jgi:hypothetical protein